MRRRLKTHSHSMSMNPGFAQSHRLKAFTRFEQFSEMLLFASVKSDPLFIREALDFFTHRFPTFVIALYNELDQTLFVRCKRRDFDFFVIRGFGSANEGLAWLRPIVQEKISERMELGVAWNPNYYDRFFETQLIEKRRNPKLQKRLMPVELLDKKSVEYRSLKKFSRSLPNTRLTEFFFSKTPTKTQPNPIPETKTGFKPKNAE